MTSVLIRWKKWSARWRPLTPATRLALGLSISLMLHLGLLMLQFGVYGAGLPGFGWLGNEPDILVQPALSLRLQQSVQLTKPDVDQEAPTPLSTPNKSAPTLVDIFSLVPNYHAPVIAKAVAPAPLNTHAVGQKHHAKTNRLALLTAPKANPNFKVAQPAASDAALIASEPVSQPDETTPIVEPSEVVGVPVEPIEETQALARRSSDQESLLKERQQQQFAAIADDTKKIAEDLPQQELAAQQALQRAQVEQQARAVEQEVRQQALQRISEQRLREQALEQKRVQQQELERLAQQQQQRELLEYQQQERVLAEQQRLQQEQQRVQQEQLRQHTELQLAERAAAARGRELQRLSEQAQASQSSAQAASGVDDLTGEPLGGSGKVRRDMDKMLAGRSADFDQRGSVLKSAPESIAPSGQRRSIFGTKTTDVELNLYKQSWRHKIERNGRLNYSQTDKDRMHTDPIVTVSVRSDGSVDSIVILRSSGRPEMDEAVRRIAMLNAPYSVFPPGLARKFDIIDIRQIWIFDDSLRIADEM